MNSQERPHTGSMPAESDAEELHEIVDGMSDSERIDFVLTLMNHVEYV
jgi:hypothetical protein